MQIYQVKLTLTRLTIPCLLYDLRLLPTGVSLLSLKLFQQYLFREYIKAVIKLEVQINFHIYSNISCYIPPCLHFSIWPLEFTLFPLYSSTFPLAAFLLGFYLFLDINDLSAGNVREVYFELSRI